VVVSDDVTANLTCYKVSSIYMFAVNAEDAKNVFYDRTNKIESFSALSAFLRPLRLQQADEQSQINHHGYFLTNTI